MLGIAGDSLFTHTGFRVVHRSQDGGRTWEPLGDVVQPWQAIDPDMAVDRDGTVWFDTLTGGCNLVAVSQDLGETWSQNPAVCLGPSRDRPRVVPTEGGEAYLYHSSGQKHAALKTTDHGQTWLPLGVVGDAGDPDQTHGWGGGGFWNRATGSVFFVFGVSTGPPSPLLGDITYAPGYAVTRDGGLSFTVAPIPGIDWEGGERIGVGLVDGVADSDGNVYIAWAEMLGEEGAVRMAVSRDDGRTWSAPIRVDGTASSKAFPTITATGPGQVAIAYYEATAPGRPESVPEGAEWNVAISWTTGALADQPAFKHARMTAEPNHQGPLCTEGGACSVGDRALSDFFDLQAYPDGRLAAVWASSTQASEDALAAQVFGATAAPVLAAAPT